MPETGSANHYTTATPTSRSFWLVLKKDRGADPSTWGHPEKGRGVGPTASRKPWKMMSSGWAMQGLSGDPRCPRRAGSPFLQRPRDLGAGDDAEARPERRARAHREPGWNRAQLNVRV